MAEPLQPADRKRGRRPKRLLDTEPPRFHPGDTARLLGIEKHTDYRQLKRLMHVVRGEPDVDEDDLRAWGSYTVREIAAARVLLDLCGGPEAVTPGKRLRLAPAANVCRLLRDLGIEEPLLTVPMQASGRTVLVQLSGDLIDPNSGDQVIAEVASSIEHRGWANIGDLAATAVAPRQARGLATSIEPVAASETSNVSQREVSRRRSPV